MPAYLRHLNLENLEKLENESRKCGKKKKSQQI